MERRILTAEALSRFRRELVRREKSPATVEKYLASVRAFAGWAGGAVTPEIACPPPSRVPANCLMPVQGFPLRLMLAVSWPLRPVSRSACWANQASSAALPIW